MALEEWPRGSKGRRPPSEHLAYDSVGACMEEYVAKRLAKGAVVFGFGSYATMKLGHSACPKSLLCMIDLLQLMFTLAPSGIVNYHLLEAVFQRLGRKWPDLNGTTKPLQAWAGAMSQSVRIAMAHVRKLAQQPRRFEQRTRGMSKEETQSLKDLVAMYKKPEDNFVNSFESEDVPTPARRLRKVD